MRKTSVALVVLCGLLGSSGCVSVKTPDNIYIGSGSGPAPQDIDSARVPDTATHEEARAELTKAYKHIRYLEHENRRLRDKVADAKEDKEEYKRKYKRLKDRYED